MRKHLIPKDGNYYKANLHCHTTVSDGKWTPEQMRDEYKARGYSVIAYTDHNIMVDHSDLTTSDFLALNGYEVNINMMPYQAPRGSRCSAEFNLIAPTPDTKMVCYQKKYVKNSAPQYLEAAMEDPQEEPFERYYSPECANALIKKARDAGYFVSYNHPLGSQENYAVYSKYKGMHAFEIYNHGAWYYDNLGYAPQVYDDILKTGNMICCIASDDTHTAEAAFGGYVMIKADRLDYQTVIEALKNGQFYSSTGPEIKEIWYENGEVHITCSSAEHIFLNTGTTFGGSKHGKEGALLTEASFKLHPLMKYVRFTVMDKEKRTAWSNAYSIEEFLHEIKE